jgi:hypothetical protein
MKVGSYCIHQGSKLNHIIQMLIFRGVDITLIVYVDLSVYELKFMTDKGYCAFSSGQQSVAS